MCRVLCTVWRVLILHCVESAHFALCGGAHLHRVEGAHFMQGRVYSFYIWLRVLILHGWRVPIYTGYRVLILLCLQGAHFAKAVKVLF